MSKREISHDPTLLGRGLLYLYYRIPPTTAGQPSDKEEVCWKVFCRIEAGHSVPLVMLNASTATWQQGSASVRADVAALVQLHSQTMGSPSTCSGTIVSTAHHAAWALWQPSGQFAFVLFTPSPNGVVGPECVSFQPVFSVDSKVGRSSLAALELIFPNVATEAVESIRFGDQHRS